MARHTATTCRWAAWGCGWPASSATTSTSPAPRTASGSGSPPPSTDVTGGTRAGAAPGRPRNARRRDALGRPLPYGTPGEPRAPEGVVRTPAETLREAQQLLDAGRPLHAHEVLEHA